MKSFPAVLLLVLLLSPLVMAVHLPVNYTCTSTVVKQFGDDAGHLARTGNTYYTYDADDNFYYSRDTGATWIKRGEKGIEYLTSNPDSNFYPGLRAVHEYIAANTPLPYKTIIYNSTDDGNSWRQIGNTIGFNEKSAKFKVMPPGLSGWSQAHAQFYLLYANGWRMEKDFSTNFPAPYWSITLPQMLNYLSKTWAVLNTRTEGGQDQARIYAFTSGTYDNFTVQTFLSGNALGNAIVGHGNALYLLMRNTAALYTVRRSINLGVSWNTVLAVSGKVPVSIRANSTHGINVVFSNGDVYRSWDGQEWKLIHNINQTAIKDLLLTSNRHYSLITAGNNVIRLGCNAWPVARYTDPYSSRSVQPGTLVTLNASPSSDLDKDSITYEWSQVSGTPQNISNRNSPAAFVNISQPGTYVFKIKLRDNGVPPMPVGSFSTKTFTLFVSGAGATPTATTTPAPEEHADATPVPEELPEPTTGATSTASPTAEATPEPTATPQPTTTVTPAPTVEATPQPTVEPTLQPTPVSEEPTMAATPETTATPIAAPPTVEPVVARISARQGEIVLMQVVGRDALGGELAYSWRQLSGRPVQLEQAASYRPSFVAYVAGVYEFEAVAISPDGRRSSPALVTVIVEESPSQAEQQNVIIALLTQLLDVLRRLFGG